MAFYEGLAKRTLTQLRKIETKLNQFGGQNGIYVCFTRRLHCKIYCFSNEKTSPVIYVGSSNFSRSGLKENLECTASINDESDKANIISYLDYIFSEKNAISILNADIVAIGSSSYKKRIELDNLSELERFDSSNIDLSNLPVFEFSLSHIVTSEKSSLNVYFGKGRWNRASGKIVPRPWYEVELITPRTVNKNPLYPKGKFLAYTDDGYIIPMKTSGAYFKNIRSEGNLEILGEWIKGKLQRNNALIPLTPVTEDSLEKYGNDKIRFYKIDDKKYYMSF